MERYLDWLGRPAAWRTERHAYPTSSTLYPQGLCGKGKVKQALAYVAGLGVYEFYVNGQRMGGSQALQPAPTDYRKTIYYNTFDVTSLLTEKNAIAIKLGNGRMFPMRQEKAYKTPFSVIRNAAST